MAELLRFASNGGSILSKGCFFKLFCFVSQIISNAISQTVIFLLHCRNGRIL